MALRRLRRSLRGKPGDRHHPPPEPEKVEGHIGGLPRASEEVVERGTRLRQRGSRKPRRRGRALARVFGSTACDARGDRERNGSRPDHPLHPLYVAKTEASDALRAERQKAEAAA